LSGQKNAYFANSLNTIHRHRSALASLWKATPRPASEGGQRKADRHLRQKALRKRPRSWKITELLAIMLGVLGKSAALKD
jgi:hypothetical protein